jgi:hypothetical protein
VGLSVRSWMCSQVSLGFIAGLKLRPCCLLLSCWRKPILCTVQIPPLGAPG